jgi:hemolysin D
LIEGSLLSISNDAVPLEKGGLVYAARVSRARSTIQVDDKLVNLSPGISVTVEVKTGHRRLIEFFFSSLLKYGQERSANDENANPFVGFSMGRTAG